MKIFTTLVAALLLACDSPTGPSITGSWTLESIRGDTLPIAESYYIGTKITQVTLFSARLTITNSLAIYSDAATQWLDDQLINRSVHYVFQVTGRDSIMLELVDGDTIRWMAFLRQTNGTLDRADRKWTPFGEIWIPR